jgi:pimeloyl-ACP methyl ester carboxylesterase
MTYSATRDSEQLRYLKADIQQFILRYQSRNIAVQKRKTLIFLVGGMASELFRARTKYNPSGPVNQTFQYDTVWLTPLSFLGDVLKLKMNIGSDNVAHDLQDRVVIAGGSISLAGISPYTFFEAWCEFKDVDWFTYGWDWRLSFDDCTDFFVKKFLPTLRADVMSATGNDPLADLVLVGHSAGGIIVNLAMQGPSPILNTVSRAITVGTPFYGYGGQLHRYFEGESYFNLLGCDKVVKTLASFPGPYAYQYMDPATYLTHAAAFKLDIPYVLMNYPSKDAVTTTQDVDAYSLGSNRYPAGIGVTQPKLDAGHTTSQRVAQGPPVGARRDAFYCIRGNQGTNTTATGLHWGNVTNTYQPGISPSPIIDDPGLVRGDGTQPAWTAKLIDLPTTHVSTISIGPLGHMFMMEEPAVQTKIGQLIGV